MNLKVINDGDGAGEWELLPWKLPDSLARQLLWTTFKVFFAVGELRPSFSHCRWLGFNRALRATY